MQVYISSYRKTKHAEFQHVNSYLSIQTATHVYISSLSKLTE